MKGFRFCTLLSHQKFFDEAAYISQPHRSVALRRWSNLPNQALLKKKLLLLWVISGLVCKLWIPDLLNQKYLSVLGLIFQTELTYKGSFSSINSTPFRRAKVFSEKS